MSAGSLLDKVSSAFGTAVSAIRSAPRLVANWLASNISRLLAVGWLTGIVAFGYVTVQRTRALAAGEPWTAAPTTAKTPASDGPAEVVEMLDVDQMNQIRADRMHANGIGAGDEDAPDLATIVEARERRGTSKAAEGEVVGKNGQIVVVSKGGVKGWISRNKNKKADPETLAWLRDEEAAEGRKSYAGWADRADGNILEWSKDQRRQGKNPGGAGSAGDAAALEELTGIKPPAALPATGSSAAPVPATATATETTTATATAPAPATATATVTVTAPATETSAAARRIDLHVLAGAARSALAASARARTDPTTEEIAAVRARITPPSTVAGTIGITTSVRDRNIVIVLVSDQLFTPGATELSRVGRNSLRDLARALRDLPDRTFRLVIDADRAMEVAATLVIAGLDADKLEVSLRTTVDRAIDLVEIELVPADLGDATGVPP